MPLSEKTLADGSTRIIPRGRTSKFLDRVQRFLENHVVEGCWVTASSTPDTNVSVSAGVIIKDNTYYRITAGTVFCGGAHSTYTRYDLIEVDETGIYFKVGTAASSPVIPDPTSGRLVLAVITRAASDNEIGSADIDNNKRPKLFNDPVASGVNST